MPCMQLTGAFNTIKRNIGEQLRAQHVTQLIAGRPHQLLACTTTQTEG